MYFPYFRGKQYELISVRENAPKLQKAGFTPIIEPVKESLGGLEKALNAICEAGGNAVVIVNPYHGDHASTGEAISALLKQKYLPRREIAAGVLLKDSVTVEEALECCAIHEDHDLTLVHAGFTGARALADGLGAKLADTRHVFFEDYCGKLYRKHFQGSQRILIGDGFEKRTNSKYPLVEPYSDLHVTYTEEGMNGFGDFLTVGDDYSEGGGPAYAIAIHLTFIDPSNDGAMFIYHFKSRRMDTPTDPAGKFAEALTAMIEKLDEPQSMVLETEAVKEFRSLHEKSHFPGLGYIKKLSMQHHIETLAAYFA